MSLSNSTSGRRGGIAQFYAISTLLNFAPSYRLRAALPWSAKADSFKRLARESWNRFSLAQVLFGTLGVADHICPDLLPFRIVPRQDSESGESGRRHESCCGRVQSALELKGGRLPRFGMIP